MNAYIYLRVSGASQVDQDGPERQRVACQEYAAANGYTIAGEYFERGVSGKSELANRPALSEMLAAMESSGVRVVIIEKLDRLARDLMVSETILADLRKSEYTLISTCEPDLCSDDPSRKLVRQIFSAIAEYERELIVLKLRGARERIKANGRHPGQKNYSQDPVLNRHAEGKRPYGSESGEGETLALMRSLRAGGSTFAQIAGNLNGLGMMARSGKPWKLQSIAKILSR